MTSRRDFGRRHQISEEEAELADLQRMRAEAQETLRRLDEEEERRGLRSRREASAPEIKKEEGLDLREVRNDSRW